MEKYAEKMGKAHYTYTTRNCALVSTFALAKCRQNHNEKENMKRTNNNNKIYSSDLRALKMGKEFSNSNKPSAKKRISKLTLTKCDQIRITCTYPLLQNKQTDKRESQRLRNKKLNKRKTKTPSLPSKLCSLYLAREVSVEK